MKTVEAMLSSCRKELGFVEGPNNSTPYAGIADHANNQPWCATFLVACARMAKVTLGNESAYTPSLYDSLPSVAKAKVRPGDLVFFYYPSKRRIAHVGIVEAVRADHIITIEGNTDEAGGRTGGRVMRKKRAYAYTHFARPTYAAPKPKPVAEPTPAPAPKKESRMIIRFKDKPHVYEVVGSHLEHITAEAFKARGLKKDDVELLEPSHPLNTLPRS